MARQKQKPKQINDNPQYDTELMFPSRYIKTADLRDRPRTLTIVRVIREEVDAYDRKLKKSVTMFPYFCVLKETDKLLWLKPEKMAAIRDFLNERFAKNWGGALITLTPGTRQVGKVRDHPCFFVTAARWPQNAPPTSGVPEPTAPDPAPPGDDRRPGEELFDIPDDLIPK